MAGASATLSPCAWASWPNSFMYVIGSCCSLTGVCAQSSGSYMTHLYGYLIAPLAMSELNWAYEV